jgi:outer membrane protein
MKAKHIFTLTLFSFALNTTVQAGELAEIYKQALNNDPQLKAAEASYKAGSEAGTQGRAGLLPNVALNANTTSIHAESANFNNHGYTLSLSQPVFDAAAWFNFKRSNVLSEQAALQFELEQQNLISRTVEAYLGVLRAKSALATSQAQERAIKRRLDQVNAQFEVGLIAITDVQEAQASFDNARVARISAEGDLDNSYEALERLTGSSFGSVSQLSENYPVDTPIPAEPAPWLEKAWQGNIGLKLADMNSEAARRSAQAAHAGHYPTLSLTASHDYDDGTAVSDDGSETNSVGLTLSMPIYSGGATSSKSRELEQRLLEAQYNREDTLRSVTQSTRSLLRNLKTGALSVQALKQSIKSSQTALEATEEGYKVGTRNVVDVLQAEQQLYSSQLEYANARFNFVQNLMTFKQQLGTLSPEDINELDSWIE